MECKLQVAMTMQDRIDWQLIATAQGISLKKKLEIELKNTLLDLKRQGKVPVIVYPDAK